ncbi:MAG: M48 family metallopeptidase [Verrucomicrobiota bacterium]|nr:MAG: M48 family metallopeptidase [Verrucomicrobiota bacterium]
MYLNDVTTAVIGLLALKLVTELCLNGLNRRYVWARRNMVPERCRSFVTLDTYQKSVDYTLAKSRFSSFCDVFDFGLDAVILLYGVLPILFSFYLQHFGTGIWGQAANFLFIHLILSLFSIPLSWWSQFRLEERFGFNQSTLKIFWSDKLKGYLLSALIGLPILALLVYLFQSFTYTWWLLVWATLTGFKLVMTILYPLIILPIFNKLTPLEDGPLKDRLFQLAQQTQFPINKIFLMDGSRRSLHSNAFFTGIGKFRHIVLYDTLVAQLTVDELAAVLAHEIGHYKKCHIRKSLLLESFCSFLGFAVLYQLAIAPWFLSSFGFETADIFVPLFVLFPLVAEGITFWFEPIFNRLSRQYEYEADRFAKTAIGSAEPLIASLQKLHQKNLSNLTPHPLFSAFYYSHPTLLEREQALRAAL